MWEVNAGEGARAKVIRAMGYNERMELAKVERINESQTEEWDIPDSYVR